VLSLPAEGISVEIPGLKAVNKDTCVDLGRGHLSLPVLPLQQGPQEDEDAEEDFTDILDVDYGGCKVWMRVYSSAAVLSTTPGQL
jgi:hypothetical protein